MGDDDGDAQLPPSKKARNDNNNSTPISNFEVYVSKDTFKFNAAHFVAFEGFRERLHGHNYRVGVRLQGSRTISQDGYLIDFGNIKDVTRKVCKRLNDHFLCPMHSNVMDIVHDKDQQQISLTCQDGSCFSFPEHDVAQLPIVHATSEELAIYLWVEILSLLDSSYLINRGIHTMETIVTEAPGQEATFRWPVPTTQQNQRLDVKSFISDGKLVPMPCIDEKDTTNNSKKNATTQDGCCPDCRKSQASFSEQLERLAQKLNEKSLSSSAADKNTKLSGADLEALLN